MFIAISLDSIQYFPSESDMAPSHDDVIKWKHFPRYWPFVREIHRWPVNSPHKGQWRIALIFSLICTGTNGWARIGDAGDSRHHLAQYDVTVRNCSPLLGVCWGQAFQPQWIGSMSWGISYGVEGEHGDDDLLSNSFSICGGVLTVCHQDWFSKACARKINFALNKRAMTRTKSHSNIHDCPFAKGGASSHHSSPQNHAPDACYNSPERRISPPSLGWCCPV